MAQYLDIEMGTTDLTCTSGPSWLDQSSRLADASGLSASAAAAVKNSHSVRLALLLICMPQYSSVGKDRRTEIFDPGSTMNSDAVVS